MSIKRLIKEQLLANIRNLTSEFLQLCDTYMFCNFAFIF